MKFINSIQHFPTTVIFFLINLNISLGCTYTTLFKNTTLTTKIITIISHQCKVISVVNEPARNCCQIFLGLALRSQIRKGAAEQSCKLTYSLNKLEGHGCNHRCTQSWLTWSLTTKSASVATALIATVKTLDGLNEEILDFKNLLRIVGVVLMKND